ncbi:MAG: polyphosphate kinase 2 family protein [Anaerolineales bacterium]|nr:polyphosphate kinase 2 family protein [Anaerolineales bacterium]
MFEAGSSPYLVPFDGSFRVSAAPTQPPSEAPGKKACKKQLKTLVRELYQLQRVLYAHDKYAVLAVFQAMDAAGKDGTIRAVMTGVNPAGFQVYSFKQPSKEELDHDFLWRTTVRLPERGRIGVFNRSYYEEVLVVNVHPAFLQSQKLPDPLDLENICEQRYQSILAHEKHLAQNGILVLKFWLNVSKEEQKQRFLARIDEPEKNWKFSTGDVHERSYWDQYMQAYQAALNATSRPWAPWYAIPADNKSYMRLQVANTLVDNLNRLDLKYPHVSPETQAMFAEMRNTLDEEA